MFRLEELKKASLSNTKHDSDEVLEQALSILRHTESIISSIRRYIMLCSFVSFSCGSVSIFKDFSTFYRIKFLCMAIDEVEHVYI